LTEFEDVASFSGLAHRLDQVLQSREVNLDLTDDERHRNAGLVAAVNTLAPIEALNVSAASPHPDGVRAAQIDMGDLVASPGVAYFFLQAPLEQKTTADIGKLALHSLLAAAVLNKERENRVYAIVDEFQQLVSQDLEIVLQMARDSKIAAVLANQTLSDLKKASVDLRPTVQQNTRFKQVFAATDPGQQEQIVSASGAWTEFDPGDAVVDAYHLEYPLRLASRTVHSRPLVSIGRSAPAPRFAQNDVIEMSDAEGLSFVQVARGYGFSQYGGHLVPTRSEYHVSFDRYTERMAAPWPEPSQYPGAFLPGDPAAKGSERSRAGAPRPTAPRKKAPEERFLDELTS
jgi:hypothetical protein